MSNIIEHKHIEEILIYIEELNDPNNTLMLFDLDDVLIANIGHFGGYRWWEKKLTELQQIGLSFEDAVLKLNDFYVKISPHLTYTFIEPSTPLVFNTIKKKGITIIGLTGRAQGSAHLTHNTLKELGLHFQSPLPVEDNLINHGTISFQYHNGIIYCNGTCKGAALHEVLTRASYHPKKIVFLDDVKKNLTDVQEKLKNTRPETNFLGVHYTHINSFTTFDAVQAEEEWQNLREKTGAELSI